MKIFIKAKPNFKEERVEKTGDNEFVVAVCEPPLEGRANRAIIAALAEYFKIPAARIKIKTGQNSKNKIIEILQ
ncbi:MAG: DUF167 domain-containing protein [Candidatus Portnoybacteria bacterium]|nr:DUF167 domain-containing protein [Candidatus Portnoybacteria bacterium]